MKANNFLYLPICFCLLVFTQNTKAQCDPSTTPGVHVVQKGENLYRIAKAYGVTMEQVGAWNNIDPRATLETCKSLYVQAPASSTAPPAAPQMYDNVAQTKSAAPLPKGTIPASAIRGRTDGLHVIQPGETIANIAEFYGYTEKRFRVMNNLADGLEPAAGSGLRSTDCDCNMDVWMLNTQNTIAPPSASGRASNVYDQGGTKPTEYYNGGQVMPDRPEDRLGNQGGQNPPSTPAPPPPSGNTGTAAPALGNIASATYMSLEERQMCNEINLLRSNPAGYVKHIEAYIQYLQTNGEMGNSISTSYELINELKKTAPLSILSSAPCLYNAAKKHGADQKPTGDTNHMGTDGSWPWDRVVRECTQMEDGNENLVGGPADIRRAVILLLVDDGIDSRGHRRTLLDERWKYVACHKVGTVGTMPNTWIQNFGF